MAKRRGAGKGQNFEREVARGLSHWLSSGERDDLLWRTAMSGGRATFQRKKGRQNLAQLGDLCSIDRLSHDFCERVFIECKFYRELNILALFAESEEPVGLLAKFWAKCCEEAALVARLPMLIAKQNNLIPLVLLTAAGVDQFQVGALLVATFPERGMFVVRFSDFLDHAERP